VKSGNLIFNLDESISEYKNKEFFQYLSEQFTSFSISENKEDEAPLEKEFLNSYLENEENILDENEKKLTIGEEDQNDLNKMGKIYYKNKDLQNFEQNISFGHFKNILPKKSYSIQF
jgi:hypothetical protein